MTVLSYTQAFPGIPVPNHLLSVTWNPATASPGLAFSGGSLTGSINANLAGISVAALTNVGIVFGAKIYWEVPLW